MKNSTSIIIYTFGLSFVLFFGCSKKEEHHISHEATEKLFYTCPMHPSVQSDKPGTCPICGMDLVEKKKTGMSQTEEKAEDFYTCPMHPTVKSATPSTCPICGMDLVKKASGHNSEDMLHLSERDQLLINLKTATAKVKDIAKNNVLLGTVVRDREGLNVITSRVKGRIEKLFLRNPGEKITKGQLLYSLYSEELLAAQTDFIQALKQRDQFQNQKAIIEEIINSSENKLKLWGMTDKQISEIEKTQKVFPYSNYYSSVNGFLSDLKITEGAYVEEGTPLFEISDLSSLWIEAQVYQEELALIEEKNPVKVEFEAFPGEEFTGEYAFSTPSLEPNQKISLLRYKIKNPDQRIKPGMMAYVRLNQGGKEALVIPKSAILLEEMKTVWVETEKGLFERRMVKTGIENKKEVEILSGIEAGEKIVTSGNYLLNSEYILQRGGSMQHEH